MMQDIKKLFRQLYHQNVMLSKKIIQVSKDPAQEPGQWFNCLCSLLFKKWEVSLLHEVAFHLWPGPSSPYPPKIFSITHNLVREAQQDRQGRAPTNKGPYRTQARSKEQRASGGDQGQPQTSDPWASSQWPARSRPSCEVGLWVRTSKAGHRHPNTTAQSSTEPPLSSWVTWWPVCGWRWGFSLLLLTPPFLPAWLLLQELNTRLYGRAKSELTLNTSSQTPGKAEESVQRLLMCTEPWYLLSTWTSL